MSEYASVDGIVAGAMSAWKPPPRLSLSEWADENFYLSAENSAEPGRWRTLPYQRAIMDAITDPSVTHVSVLKSARVGYTLMVLAAMGYYVHHAPCNILCVQPTVDDARGFSKETVAPALRDVPVLSRIIFEDAEEKGPRDGGNTILHKKFPGGVLSMVGANSGAGFRRVSRKVVIFDEVDAYPPSAGSDGDPIKLGTMRTQSFWDRKIISGSTPLIAGASRIEDLYSQGDQRRYFVPCPECGHMAPFIFRAPTEEGQPSGHVMRWPEGRPEAAFFSCERNGCVIEHRHKRDMVERGEWRAARPFTGHASFHIWAAYSYSPNATWGQLAAEFLESKGKPEKLKTFVNTVLGETWQEKGEAPEWKGLYDRREDYRIATVPAGVLVLTAGVDVQKDRFVYEVVGWGVGKESWSIDADVIPANTSNLKEWEKLDELLNRSYSTAAGTQMTVRWMAVDSGYETNTVYSWARQHRERVIATKGSSSADVILGVPKPVDVKVNGKRIARGFKVWAVGVDIAKAELYGQLRLEPPETGQPCPPGWCHFPQHGEEYFRQLTAEHQVSHKDKHGFTVRAWEMLPGRENHWLDARVYARAAASLAGLDRMGTAPPGASPPPPPALPIPTAPSPPSAPPQSGGFLRGNRASFLPRGRRWLK